ncbi:MAG: hypothetical protein ACRCXB_03590 [Aeromonadaceae bacterium]
MSKKFFRQILVARCIPIYPRKLSSVQVKDKLAEDGVIVALRTIQRDLDEMSCTDFFGVFCDQRNSPYGWSRINSKSFLLGGSMPLSLAIAIHIWSSQSNRVLPSAIEDELAPLIKHAKTLISRCPGLDTKINTYLAELGGKTAIVEGLCDDLWRNS